MQVLQLRSSYVNLASANGIIQDHRRFPDCTDSAALVTRCYPCQQTHVYKTIRARQSAGFLVALNSVDA